MKTWYARECVQLSAHAWLCVWVCVCDCVRVYLCCTHSSVVRRLKHDSLSATLRLWKQHEIDLVCERGEVKVHFMEGWVGLMLQMGDDPVSTVWRRQRHTAVNRWGVDVTLYFPHIHFNVQTKLLVCLQPVSLLDLWFYHIPRSEQLFYLFIYLLQQCNENELFYLTILQYCWPIYHKDKMK